MQTKNVKRLLANDGICLVTHPEVALILGKSEAIFLQQLHYWLTSDSEIGTVLEGKRWIYNSYKAWADNLRIYSESTIRRAISKLEKMGIILTQNLNKKKSDHTKWYTINYDALKNLIPGLSNSKQQDRAGESKPNGRLLKMSSPSVQNEHIINNENKKDFRDKTLSHTKIPSNENTQTNFEKDKFRQMVLIWNQIVEEGKKTIELNSKRISFLKKAFETKFEYCLEKWKEFCRRVASSKFLMGEIKASFKASLDWVLKFDILQRILEGDYGVGDRVVYGRTIQNDSKKIETEIQNAPENQLIKQFRLGLLNRIGLASYSSWFKDTKIRIENKQLIVIPVSSFAKDYINRVFLEDIRKISIPEITITIDS
ncbi:MAG: hypothetical protein K2W94_00980 [Alphaproteobacteria bacterium]|nr:hypothetical protein [Alphaproteobacteria bacterium]